MVTCGPNSRSRGFVLVATPARLTPLSLHLLPRVFARATGSPPYSLTVSRATLAPPNPCGPNRLLPRLSYMTPSLEPSRPACGATRHNMPTSGTVTSSLTRTWLRGQVPPGGGNFRSFHLTSPKVYVASPSPLARQSHYSRSRPGTWPTPPNSFRTDSRKSSRSPRTVPLRASAPTSSTDTGSSLIQSYPLRCGQSSPRLQLYHGPTDIDSWFPAVFGSYSMSTLHASRLLLVTSTGRPYCSGLPPPRFQAWTLSRMWWRSIEPYRPRLQAILVVCLPVVLLCISTVSPLTRFRWVRGRSMSICIVTRASLLCTLLWE